MVLNITFQAKDEGLRAVDALRKHYAFSNRRIKKIKFQGYFKLNGQDVYLVVPVKAGDVAEISDDATKKSDIVLKSTAQDYVVHSTDWFIAANKPAKILTHPNFWQKDTALTNILCEQDLHLVNRLDKDSSGLVLLATSPHAHSVCTQLKLEKYYLTIVHGNVASKNFGADFIAKHEEANLSAQIEKGLLPDLNLACEDSPVNTCNYCAFPICRREASILERRISLEQGKSCLTLFRKLAYNKEQNISLLLCKLLTGRTHQIRLHFLSMGHPLVGESLYDLANLAEMAKLGYSQRALSFKEEISLEERIQMDNLRFIDNPLNTTQYISYLADLLQLRLSQITDPNLEKSIYNLTTSPAFKRIQLLNNKLNRQALHAWSLNFANPANYPNNSSNDFYSLFAPLQPDMSAFMTTYFKQAQESITDYQFKKTHYPELNF